MHKTGKQRETGGGDKVVWITANVHCSDPSSNAPGRLSPLENQSTRQNSTIESGRGGAKGEYKRVVT